MCNLGRSAQPRPATEEAENILVTLREELGSNVTISLTFTRRWTAKASNIFIQEADGIDIHPPELGMGRSPELAVTDLFKKLKGVQGRRYILCGVLKLQWQGAQFSSVG
jgi:hypothetical protein